MGAVYVGSHTRLQKRVAIKVLRSELTGAVEIVERFLREAVAASRIGHENIIEVTDIGKAQNGAPFIVMELLEGENLAARIKRVGPLPVAQACHIAVEILSAMEAAHRAGIVHRDLKPENVFLVRKSRSESVKVLDFGISRMVQTEEGQHRLTLTGLVLGTPYYMSPEQACGDSEITAAADIYAVGVILYEMLTAKVPFEATNYNSLIYKVLSGSFPPARTYVPLPEPLEQIIYRAMALRPEHRFESATELGHALEPFLPPPSTQPFPIHWSPSPAGGFMPAPSAGSSPVMSQVPLRQAPGQEAYSPTVADSGPFVGMEMAQAAPPLEEPPRRRSRGALFAIAAVIALGGVGAALAVMQNASSEEPADPVEQPQEPPPPQAPSPPPSPTQAASAPAAPAESDAEAPPPGEPVTLTFVVTPADAVIRAGGVPIEGTRLTAPKASPEVVIEVAREGYVSKQRKVSFDANREIEIILERERSTRRPPRRSSPRPAKQEPKRGDKRIITDSPYD